MENLLDLHEIPTAERIVMLVGWRQWADAGSISSGLPEYLIEQTGARKIGEIKSESFYMFQIPGTHHLLRPSIKLQDGYRQEIEVRRNEFFYAGSDELGLVIFLGDEPHLNVAAYAASFFEAVRQLNVSSVTAVSGVYAPVPYDLDRQISCIYSLPHMKADLEPYAVTFSDYEGGASIGSYLVSEAEAANIPMTDLYVIVPAYDFPQSGAAYPQGIRIDHDYKAWYDLLRRLNHMYDLSLDLADLVRRSDELAARMDEQINELEEQMPQLGIRDFIDTLNEQFTELPFMPLGDVWEEQLNQLFEDFDE